MTSNIPSKAEEKRLDDLTAVNSTLLNGLSGERLDAVLAEVVRKRHATGDAAYRAAVLNGTHPDDLFECLAKAGVTLASLGIHSVQR